MTETHRGSCLCGAVQFEITGAFDQFFLCHCSRCRKGSGSAHGANLFSTTAKLTWLSGQDKIKTYCVPDSRHERCFCVECGSMAPGVKANGADWDHDLETAPACDGLPE